MDNTADNWTWTEPTNEEFDRRRRTETFYRIFHMWNEKEITDYKFWGKDKAEALAVLSRWKSSEKAQPGIEYFYSTAGYHLDSDGRRFDSFAESMEAYLRDRNVFQKIHTFLVRSWALIDDWWWRFKDLVRRAFTGHSIVESWDIMNHILDDLEYNLPLLIRYTHSYPNGITFDEWKKILEDLLLHIRLYRFYSDFGIVHGNDPDELAFGETWGPTIPREEGTNEEIDYSKLYEMIEREWNLVMDTIRKWGPSMWD